ncbi:MAG: phosphoribosylglycinamide formyltransferase [Thermoplasmatota archaeon]
MKLAVLASGGGSNFTSILDKVDAGILDAKVSLLVCDKPNAGCMDTAKDRGVPFVHLPPEGEARAAYDARLRDILLKEAPDLVVLAGFMRILSPTFVDAFPGKIINIHPALLPRHKGAHGVRDTLAAGDARAGATTHFVTAELDGGPLILQASVPVLPSDDLQSLQARVLAVEHWLLPRTIQLIAEGRVSPEGRVAPGPSWKHHPIPDADWPEGF